MQLKPRLRLRFRHSDASTQRSIANGSAILSQLNVGQLRRLTCCYVSPRLGFWRRQTNRSSASQLILKEQLSTSGELLGYFATDKIVRSKAGKYALKAYVLSLLSMYTS